jgi:hypothetical protein
MNELDEVDVYISNDIIKFERERFGCRISVDGFQVVSAYNWLQATNHSIRGYSHGER